MKMPLPHDILRHTITGERLRILHLAEDQTICGQRVEQICERDTVSTTLDRVMPA